MKVKNTLALMCHGHGVINYGRKKFYDGQKKLENVRKLFTFKFKNGQKKLECFPSQNFTAWSNMCG
jgi:hypothetical protein